MILREESDPISLCECTFIYFLLQAVYNKKEEFFLFGSVMEATMIDKK